MRSLQSVRFSGPSFTNSLSLPGIYFPIYSAHEVLQGKAQVPSPQALSKLFYQVSATHSRKGAFIWNIKKLNLKEPVAQAPV